MYAEPSMLEECANELIDMGKMVDSAERYGAMIGTDMTLLFCHQAFLLEDGKPRLTLHQQLSQEIKH